MMPKRILSLLVFSFCLAGSLFSFQWPVEDPVLVETFAESSNDTFSEGINLLSPHNTVKPVSRGEIVFYQREKARQSDVPSPLGNLVVLQHTRGIYSFYAHLGKIAVNNKNFVLTKRDVLGTMGTSGMSRGKSLYLVLLDGDFKQFVNPLLSLPQLIDTAKPEIGNLYLFTPRSTEIVKKRKTIPSGVYTLAVEARDFSNNVNFYCPVAPYSIDFYVNGELKKSIKFEFLTVKNNKKVLQNSLGTYSGVYERPWLYTIGSLDISPGDSRIEISVKDFEGNETVKTFSIKSKEKQ